jgi:uncharacterized membrane protein
MKNSIQTISLQILSIIGLLVCIYLYLSHIASSYFCPVGDCLTVNTSKYAQIGNIPMSVLGFGFYSILFVGTFFLQHKMLNKILKIVLVCGLMFSVYLTFLEIFVIKAICFWCVISFILVILSSIIIFNPFFNRARNT